MRGRCQKAFDEQKIEIEKQAVAAGAEPRKKKDEGGGEGGDAPASPGGDAGGGGGGGGGLTAKEPEAGDDLGLDDAGKEERMGKKGTLKLHLASASGLAAADKNGLSDPCADRGARTLLPPRWDPPCHPDGTHPATPMPPRPWHPALTPPRWGRALQVCDREAR